MGHKILIVDDEPAVLDILKRRLEADGYQVITAANGVEGLAKFKAEKADLVMTDVMMPGLTGYEFFEGLRTLDGGTTGPVIVTSARGSLGQFFDAWDIVAFVKKPYDTALLLKTIREILTSSAPKPPVEKVVTVPKNDSLRTILLAGVSEFAMKKVKEFLEQNACTVVQGLDEEDTFKTALKIKPDFILFEFWEEAERFDAVKLFRYLSANSTTRQVPYAVFCKSPLQNDARKDFNAKHLLVFTDAVELVNHIESLMQTREFQKRSY